MKSLIKYAMPLLLMYACVKIEPPKREDYLSNFGKELRVSGGTYNINDWNNDGNIDALTADLKCYAFDTTQVCEDSVNKYSSVYETTLRLSKQEFELINTLTRQQRIWLYRWDSLMYEAIQKHKKK
ncbi:MAG: hypothetical protein WC758_03930 [Candidatus Woesearchaeota archaeon]|jgi:hypothetical protein